MGIFCLLSPNPLIFSLASNPAPLSYAQPPGIIQMPEGRSPGQQPVKQKSRQSRDLFFVKMVIFRKLIVKRLFFLRHLTRFYHCTDALCTNNLANLTSFIIYSDPLKIRTESTPGSLLGPGTITTKSRLLPTILTLCHLT